MGNDNPMSTFTTLNLRERTFNCARCGNPTTLVTTPQRKYCDPCSVRPTRTKAAPANDDSPGPRRCLAVWGDVPCRTILAKDNPTNYCVICTRIADELVQAQVHRDRVRQRLKKGLPKKVIPLGHPVPVVNARTEIQHVKQASAHRRQEVKALEEVLS